MYALFFNKYHKNAAMCMHCTNMYNVECVVNIYLPGLACMSEGKNENKKDIN